MVRLSGLNALAELTPTTSMPRDALPEHKIQSHGSSADARQKCGGLDLHLCPVPKVLGASSLYRRWSQLLSAPLPLRTPLPRLGARRLHRVVQA